jgi:hypothetical protein
MISLPTSAPLRLLAAAAFTVGVSLLSATSPALAQQNPSVQVQQIAVASFRVRITNPATQDGEVQVVSLQSGQVLFSEAYTDKAYGHRFDFRQLPQGRYALRVKQGGERHRYLVKVQNGNGQRTIAIRTVKSRLPEPSAVARVF